MTAHARLGASKSERWMNCPGSVALTADIPETTSKYAEEGTVAHELAALMLRGQVPGPGTDEDMLNAVDTYVDYVRGQSSDAQTLFIETQFNLAPLSPPEPMFGTADAVVWDESSKTLEVIDYKHGQGVYVEVQDNPQFLMYALGAVVELKKRPDVIRTTVVQPRHHADPKIRSAEYTWEELVAFKKNLFERAKATQTDGALLAVGSWCKFCPAQATCPAQHAHATQVAQCDFQVLEGREDPNELPIVERLSDEQLKFVLENADIVRDWFTAVEAHVLTRLADGGSFNGYKIVAGKTNRKWKDEAHITQYLARKGLKKSERTTTKLISPAQAEKVFKAKGLGKLPERFTEQPVGAPRLAPESDKRPAITVGAQDVFLPHTEE